MAIRLDGTERIFLVGVADGVLDLSFFLIGVFFSFVSDLKVPTLFSVDCKGEGVVSFVGDIRIISAFSLDCSGDVVSLVSKAFIGAVNFCSTFIGGVVSFVRDVRTTLLSFVYCSGNIVSFVGDKVIVILDSGDGLASASFDIICGGDKIGRNGEFLTTLNNGEKTESIKLECSEADDSVADKAPKVVKELSFFSANNLKKII